MNHMLKLFLKIMDKIICKWCEESMVSAQFGFRTAYEIIKKVSIEFNQHQKIAVRVILKSRVAGVSTLTFVLFWFNGDLVRVCFVRLKVLRIIGNGGKVILNFY